MTSPPVPLFFHPVDDCFLSPRSVMAVDIRLIQLLALHILHHAVRAVQAGFEHLLGFLQFVEGGGTAHAASYTEHSLYEIFRQSARLKQHQRLAAFLSAVALERLDIHLLSPLLQHAVHRAR